MIPTKAIYRMKAGECAIARLDEGRQETHIAAGAARGWGLPGFAIAGEPGIRSAGFTCFDLPIAAAGARVFARSVRP